MSKKECFINFVETLMDESSYGDWDEEVMKEWEPALEYWNALKAVNDPEKPKFTDNGKLILKFMIENEEEFGNLFKAKDIGERISISSRTVSGSIRKLVTDGYVEKIGNNPTIYTLNDKGRAATFEED